MDEPTTPTEEELSPLRRFWSRHWYALIIAIGCMGAGVGYAQYSFPELSTLQTVGGGLFFGLFCAGCALGYRMIEME